MRVYYCNINGHIFKKECKPEYSCYRVGCYTRYVRADVAMRYARMKERKGYEIAQDYGPHKCIYGADNTIVAGDDDIRWNTYEEAQQAWIKQNRGNVAQREA